MAKVTGNQWKCMSLGDLFQIKHGYPFKGEYFAETGQYILLTPGNFKKEGGIQLKQNGEKYYTGDFPDEYILNKNDILIAMTDLKQDAPILGSAAIIPIGGIYLHNQRLGKIINIDSQKIHPLFLYYLLNSRIIREQIKSSATGSTVRHTAPERIYRIKAYIPSLQIQYQIANILSDYDELIENNTRRIAILEEMARLLYREWFVNFRFPGHEEVKMVDSPLGPIPEGWEIKKLGDLADDVRRSVSPEQVDPGTPYFGLEHFPRRSIALSEWGRAEDVQSTKLVFKKGDILFGKIRPYFHKVGVAPIDGVCSTDAIVIIPKDPEFFSLVLCTVSSDEFIAHATQTSQGTKMPRANWSVLADYRVVMPNDVILKRFHTLISEMIALIENLIFITRNLRTTRDLLLPRLISGEIDVSNLDNAAIADTSLDQ